VFCCLLAITLAAGASGVESREVAFQSAGYRLVGTLTLPARAPAAGVLIIPGSGPIDRNGSTPLAPQLPPVYRQWAQGLGEAGIAALRYDKRFLTHPEVDLPSFDQEAQIADAQSALAFLRSAPELAGKPVFVLGHSEGGTLAPIVAERSAGTAGVAIINTVHFPVDELLLAQLRAAPNVTPQKVDEVRQLLADVKRGSFPARGLLLGAGTRYWSQWIGYSTEAPATLVRLREAVLLVQSMNDETLPGGTLERNVAILASVTRRKQNAELHKLQGHDHFGMLPPGREPSSAFMHTLTTWLLARAK